MHIVEEFNQKLQRCPIKENARMKIYFKVMSEPRSNWWTYANIFRILSTFAISLISFEADAVDCVTKESIPPPPDGNVIQIFSIKGKLSQVAKGGFYFYNYYQDSDNGIYSIHTLGEVTVALHKSKPFLIMLYKGNEAQYVYTCSQVIKIIQE